MAREIAPVNVVRNPLSARWPIVGTARVIGGVLKQLRPFHSAPRARASFEAETRAACPRANIRSLVPLAFMRLDRLGAPQIILLLIPFQIRICDNCVLCARLCKQTISTQAHTYGSFFALLCGIRLLSIIKVKCRETRPLLGMSALESRL